MMLKFLVKGQKIEILEREVIASDQIAFVTLKFVFDGDWKKFHKVVQFPNVMKHTTVCSALTDCPVCCLRSFMQVR